MINEWPIPKNIHKLRSFLGISEYYRLFIEKFSIIARPLHGLKKKHVKFEWSKKQNDAFEKF